MEIIKVIIDLMRVLVWPILIVSIILIFYKQLRSLLDNVSEIRYGKFKAKLNKDFNKISRILTQETIDELREIEDADIDSKEKTRLKQQYLTEQFERISNTVESLVRDGVKETNKVMITPGNGDIKNRILLGVPSGQTRDRNLKYNIYYDPEDRTHRFSFKYIGLYDGGTIFAVGEVKKIAYCNLDDSGNLIPRNGYNLDNLTEDEKKRIKGIIEEDDLDAGLKFFLVDKFQETNYWKESDYPLRGKKYFWLDEVEGFKEGMSSLELANLLKEKCWE